MFNEEVNSMKRITSEPKTCECYDMTKNLWFFLQVNFDVY